MSSEPHAEDEPCFTQRHIREILPLLRYREQQILRARFGLLVTGVEWTIADLRKEFKVQEDTN